MKINSSWKIGVLVALAAILSMAAMGVTYAAGGTAGSLCAFSWTFSNDDGTIGKPAGFSGGIDPDDNGLDPRQDQNPGVVCQRAAGDVASTSASFSPQAITFYLNNAYPGYSPTIFFGLSNQWATPGYVQEITIQNPNSDLLEVKLNGIAMNQVIAAGAEAAGALSIEVGDIPSGSQNNYALSVTIAVSQWSQPGQTISIENTVLADGQSGQKYTQTLTGSNGNTPYSWQLTSGALPAGLRLDSATGIISGTPVYPGTYNFEILLTDDTGDTAGAALSITINAAPAGGNGGSTGAPGGQTTVTEPAPSGSTAELPPTGSTAQISPAAPAPSAVTTTPAHQPAGQGESEQPAATPATAETPLAAPPAVPGDSGAAVSGPSLSVNVTGAAQTTSVNWLLIASILVIAVVMLFCFLLLYFYRRKKKKEEDANNPKNAA